MKPIIFSTDMVRAILAGYKTQTRRIARNTLGICKECWEKGIIHNGKQAVFGGTCYLKFPYCEENKIAPPRLRPKYQVNDILYVRETFCYFPDWSGEMIITKTLYKADRKKPDHDALGNKTKWKPSIFMPKEAARIFLRVTNVRVERLQDIEYDDCFAEGINIFLQAEDTEDPYWEVPAYWKRPDGTIARILQVDHPFDGFFNLWDSINKKRGYGWETNPFVFVYDFMIKEVKK